MKNIILRILTAALALLGGAAAFGQTETVLYTFQGQAGNDGYFPEIYPLVLDTAGNLYGTTTYGGGGPCIAGPYAGCGFIYQLVPSASGGAWTENAIWRFQGGTDGGYPGQLLMVHGTLWGVAGTGGTTECNCGYFFRLDPPAVPGGAWTKTHLFDFPATDYSCGISASDAKGNFYGVGGISANGNICELVRPTSPGGLWTTIDLYEFQGVPPGQSLGDGSGPLGVTFDAHGRLWGATVYGGHCQRFQGGSCFGTIFVLTPPAALGDTWTETVAFRFTNDDQNPTSSVVIGTNGAVYGVTYVETYKFYNGHRTVISSFSDDPPNPYAPAGGVAVDQGGNVYGVTAAGGAFGDGTVYELSAGVYTQTILHSFAGGTDGWNPEGPPILGPGGVIYGTTQIGGNQGCNLGFGGTGCGIVFQVIP